MAGNKIVMKSSIELPTSWLGIDTEVSDAYQEQYLSISEHFH